MMDFTEIAARVNRGLPPDRRLSDADILAVASGLAADAEALRGFTEQVEELRRALEWPGEPRAGR